MQSVLLWGLLPCSIHNEEAVFSLFGRMFECLLQREEVASPRCGDHGIIMTDEWFQGLYLLPDGICQQAGHNRCAIHAVVCVVFSSLRYIFVLTGLQPHVQAAASDNSTLLFELGCYGVCIYINDV